MEEREFSTGFVTGEGAGEQEGRFIAQKTGDGAAAWVGSGGFLEFEFGGVGEGVEEEKLETRKQKLESRKQK